MPQRPGPTAVTLALLVALALLSCDRSDQDGRLLIASAHAALPASAPEADQGQVRQDAYDMTFVGGPYSGTHHGMADLGCFTYGGLWQAMWEAGDEEGLSGFMLQLLGVPAAGGESVNLSFTAVLGSQMAADVPPVLIDVLGAEYGGDGRGTVVRQGDGATIRLEGTAPQGSWVTAEFRCGSVEEPS